jgi:hypothetical protein
LSVGALRRLVVTAGERRDDDHAGDHERRDGRHDPSRFRSLRRRDLQRREIAREGRVCVSECAQLGPQLRRVVVVCIVDGQRVQRGIERGRRRLPLRTHRLRDIRHRETGEVAQHDCVTLASRKRRDRVAQVDLRGDGTARTRRTRGGVIVGGAHARARR